MPDVFPTLRLPDLNPAHVALSVAGVVIRRIVRESSRVGLAVRLADSPPLDEMWAKDVGKLTILRSEAFRAAQTLAEWAKTGQGAPTATIGALLAEVRADLDGRPPDAARRSLPEPTTAAGLILLAAGARLALVEGRPVTAVELAALAGRDERTIRAAAAAGTLRPIDGGRPMRFAVEVAHTYLHARGVAGFVSAG